MQFTCLVILLFKGGFKLRFLSVRNYLRIKFNLDCNTIPHSVHWNGIFVLSFPSGISFHYVIKRNLIYLTSLCTYRDRLVFTSGTTNTLFWLGMLRNNAFPYSTCFAKRKWTRNFRGVSSTGHCLPPAAPRQPHGASVIKLTAGVNQIDIHTIYCPNIYMINF